MNTKIALTLASLALIHCGGSAFTSAASQSSGTYKAGRFTYTWAITSQTPQQTCVTVTNPAQSPSEQQQTTCVAHWYGFVPVKGGTVPEAVDESGDCAGQAYADGDLGANCPPGTQYVYDCNDGTQPEGVGAWTKLWPSAVSHDPKAGVFCIAP